MYRGTTPIHIFRTDVDLTDASVLFITYVQNCKVILEKELSDVKIQKETITVFLSQKETLLFTEGIITIQIRAKFPDGSSIASSLIRTSAKEILKDGEI
ncbi:TPA: hypothetical protein TVN94_000045 [Streptococcus equi subsp. zooepidemicus]|uniref:hypothetical protein n=1 Tax=Streptococcus equi TaxID=1336 RepID=UPI00197F4F3D|nr:hypothetical protein [Streptococcus equi]MCD3406891.1 hypothetical protein [Streptococcus equi subsp. zooepidemicus]MDI5946335.1 hypothetical protein [Streptococcus equi subsp. zooepidemicus]MDI5957408.1 hypothetical protein [Streptococcus equi subsp. zooepidemicus]MDI6087963.1 hypothetical protein [Streptococcus equi subsp. zooepidemicus]QUQ78342.1 hypothetical protein JDBNIEOD_01378 [Streptococcus equi subsp. zooepidemicus]